VALAREKGVRLERVPVALDAFVFIVHRENPVQGLTVDQIRDIYSGKATTWNQVGGPELPVHPYRRNRNSGSEETMQKVVMKGLEMVEGRDLVSMSMMGPFNALTHDRQGLGYTFRYYDTYMTHLPTVRAVAVGGVSPTPETIRNRTYPFVTPVWMVWRTDLADDSPAAKVRDWLLSPAGQAVVAESGYVPIGNAP
jgi:phosphate transport system substrate-binding protein